MIFHQEHIIKNFTQSFLFLEIFKDNFWIFFRKSKNDEVEFNRLQKIENICFLLPMIIMALAIVIMLILYKIYY